MLHTVPDDAEDGPFLLISDETDRAFDAPEIMADCMDLDGAKPAKVLTLAVLLNALLPAADLAELASVLRKMVDARN